VIGMNPGERRTVEVLPEEAYGNAGPDAREQIGRGDLPAGVEVGDRVSLTTDRGRCNFWITRLDDDSAELSRNHPLAGQKLIFELELVRVLPDDRS